MSMPLPAVLRRPAWLTTLAMGFVILWLIIAAFGGPVVPEV